MKKWKNAKIVLEMNGRKMFYDWRTIVIHFVREKMGELKAYKKAISLMI